MEFRSDQSNRENWFTSKGGPIFSKLFRLHRSDPFSFRPKFPDILAEWITLMFCRLQVAGCRLKNRLLSLSESTYCTSVSLLYQLLGCLRLAFTMGFIRLRLRQTSCFNLQPEKYTCRVETDVVLVFQFGPGSCLDSIEPLCFLRSAHYS